MQIYLSSGFCKRTRECDGFNSSDSILVLDTVAMCVGWVGTYHLKIIYQVFPIFPSEYAEELPSKIKTINKMISIK